MDRQINFMLVMPYNNTDYDSYMPTNVIQTLVIMAKQYE